MLSRIGNLEMDVFHWVVSLVCHGKSIDGHLIFVLEGESPVIPNTGWIWAADFVPARPPNPAYQRAELSSGFALVQAPGIVRTYHDPAYGAKPPEHFYLGDEHVTLNENTLSKSWQVTDVEATPVQALIMQQYQNPPAYFTLGSRSFLSAISNYSGHNCATWAKSMAEQCGAKGVGSYLDYIATISSLQFGGSITSLSGRR